MDRLEKLRQVIDEIVRQNPDAEEARCGFVHLYGVSTVCTILALRRGLDPLLCSAAGMLHDIWNYKVGDSPEHGPLGAVEAEKILSALGSYTQEEIRSICEAISQHGDKVKVDGELAELLKDADVFQHYLYHPLEYLSKQHHPARLERLERVHSELGIRG